MKYQLGSKMHGLKLVKMIWGYCTKTSLPNEVPFLPVKAPFYRQSSEHKHLIITKGRGEIWVSRCGSKVA